MAAPPSSGLTPYNGPWTDNEVTHLLKRCLFGASVSDIAHFKNKTLSAAVAELLTPASTAPPPPVKEYTTPATATTPDNNIAMGTTWVNDANNDGSVDSYRRASFKKWWMGLMINQDRSLLEKMTLFWHNHFSTETTTVGNSQFVYKHHAMLRTNALGNFRTLVLQVTTDPAMLVYLNGQYNTASAPDENYGRELQELFTVGKGPGSQYTEADVKAAAHVLTGWQNNSTTISSFFNPKRHDSTDKQFSAFYNNTVIKGQSDANAGATEIAALIDMILGTDESPKYICRCLYRYFVYYDIDDTVEANVITPLAAIFRANNFELKPVLSTLLQSQHFFDALIPGSMIKSPCDFVVGLCREFNITFPPASDYASNYGFFNWLVGIVTNMAQNIGDPPNVSGWPAYYQEPNFYELWLNSDILPKRNQYSDALVVTGYSLNGHSIKIDWGAFAKSLPNPSDPNQLLLDCINILYRIPLSDDARATIKTDILLGGQTNDTYWTTAWAEYVANPADMANTTIVLGHLRDLLKYLMDLSEYQLI
ncbi:DUF1800 domain-containing protein [Puia dinghuensis]|uniref:DUF1800 domain-containing protein n=1 Tax=Puia dinghuensis TaxID=1792502 RepID=A0A8J2UHF8_9BACT|nr:DUF1800 domain-containing protein [Puia dinghuensis]GGB17409.1 hypothetical protein GCM10011511_46500 [Puia dinghuensis]